MTRASVDRHVAGDANGIEAQAGVAVERLDDLLAGDAEQVRQPIRRRASRCGNGRSAGVTLIDVRGDVGGQQAAGAVVDQRRAPTASAGGSAWFSAADRRVVAAPPDLQVEQPRRQPGDGNDRRRARRRRSGSRAAFAAARAGRGRSPAHCHVHAARSRSCGRNRRSSSTNSATNGIARSAVEHGGAEHDAGSRTIPRRHPRSRRAMASNSR